jgi:hypothetical protein
MGHQKALLESKNIKQIILKERKSERLATVPYLFQCGDRWVRDGIGGDAKLGKGTCPRKRSGFH